MAAGRHACDRRALVPVRLPRCRLSGEGPAIAELGSFGLIRTHRMKTSRAFALAAAALVVGFLVASLCVAQPSSQALRKEPASYDFGALQQLTSFVTYLQDTKQ